MVGIARQCREVLCNGRQLKRDRARIARLGEQKIGDGSILEPRQILRL